MKRFRVFAGPNGSGKSTVIKSVKEYIANDHSVQFGIYINADEIAEALVNGNFAFDTYELTNVASGVFRRYAVQSGLLRNDFTLEIFDSAHRVFSNTVILTDPKYKELMAQVLSNFLVEHLITLGKKCTVETVFSHKSKVDFMRLAAKNGYKVYLYFVATEDPEINKERVKARVKDNGHNVPEKAIEDRYYRSLGLMYEAALAADNCYFFDNSGTEDQRRMIAWCEGKNGQKVWNDYDADNMPGWFVKYYLNKEAVN